MYGNIYAYIWLIFMVNVGKYTIHGSYGYVSFSKDRNILKLNAAPGHGEVAPQTRRGEGFFIGWKKTSDVWENSRKLQELKIET